MEEILQLSFIGNTVWEWLIGAGVFGVVLLVLYVFKWLILYRLHKLAEKTNTDVDDLIIESIKVVHWPFYILASFFIGIKFISVPEIIYKISYYALLIAIVYYAVRSLEKFIDWSINKITKTEQEDLEEGKEGEVPEQAGIVKLMATLAKVALWAGAIALLLANMGYDITSLVAGLGIGGIAIALAVQNLLGDLFSSLSIYLDKPFRPGDFINVGSNYGTVKHVGIKTTRIETLQGEELIVSNSQLTSSEVKNFGVMEYRRIPFTVGVVYGTEKEKLKKIPDMIKEVINREQNIEVERVHFKSFGDYSLVFEAVYYVQTADYIEYMDIQERINLGIVEKFEQEKIEMAFPTQTV
ncbi:MAG: mechanosensitive ion channel family protein, partial [Patescibacteria group bacterium]